MMGEMQSAVADVVTVELEPEVLGNLGRGRRKAGGELGVRESVLVIILAGKNPSPGDICKIILAIILPPLGVFLERGCGADLLINILLTILGYIPGIIHALYIILKY
ncbi:hypothetical protein B2J93_2470 [Marssonina coronariae]|uniref:Plasma membrane proteolipid 3 n=1 Tax=Diplocarpon coronariae TaxID=2795749 RepID=A0A218YSY1_9HELO|nr:hypothetical protein B2J93_2470 [Marssonina coronariae]